MSDDSQALVSWDANLPEQASMRAVARHAAIMQFAEQRFEFGKHYDSLPGKDTRNKTRDQIKKDPNIKKFLKKPGAEMISMAFGVRPEYTAHRELDEKGVAYYWVECRVFTIGSDVQVGAGIGSCSFGETKYAYRWVYGNEIENDPDLRLLDKSRLRKRSGESSRGSWTQYRVPNLDIADLDNTILKMAKKRSYVDAVITTFGLSEQFEQDIEAAALTNEDKIFDRQHSPSAEAPKAPKGKKLSKGARDVWDNFGKRVRELGWNETRIEDAMGALFEHVGIKDWYDISSEEQELKATAWMDLHVVEFDADTD